VVRGEDDLDVAAEQVDGLGQVLRPTVRVSHHGPPQRQQVVQRVGGVLCRTQRLVVREVEQHLRGCLGVRSHLEDDPHPVDDLLLPGRRHQQRRRDERHGPGRGRLTQPCTHRTLDVAGKCRPYMYPARRPIAVPVNTFSETACSTNPSGASTATRPASTSFWVVTPFTPPKWST
jgi:hypothetical protein